MVCLDTTRTVALVAGALSAGDRAAIDRHLSGCDRCRRVVSEAARDPSTLCCATEVGYAGAGESVRPPPPGDRVGRFLIRGVLGTGGMGVVYDAFDEQLQRPVALKQLRPRAGAGEAAPPNVDPCLDPCLEPWLSEARTLARLDHPNVVTLYEVVPHAGAHFLALERVDGVTLRVWLRARRRTTEEILDIFVAAAHGLEAAHAAGIVHRDFKPDNVLVGRDGRVRVADFGLAMPTTQREPVAAAGTPRYVAPEQARGEPPDARSDQYSFAVALLEAVSGATPAQGPTSRARAKRANPTALKTVPSGTQAVPLPHGLWAVISRALAVRPADRFPSLAALIGALQGARRRRMTRRRLALAAAVGSVLIGASAHGAWQAHVEAVATRQRLEAAHESAAHKTREAALLRAREATMAEEAATLRSRQAENAEEAEALRAQIASLAGDLTGGASAEARALRRTLRQRNNQVRALAQQLARQRDNPGQDDGPDPNVVEQKVRRLSGPLQVCLMEADGRIHLPVELGASLLITASGVTARADVTGIEDPTRRSCVARVLAGLRVPPFQRPAVRTYTISLSWLGLEARIHSVQ
jgi:eukaryotic-like serine/threonine-protein kinase